MCGVAHVLRFQDRQVLQERVDGIVNEVIVGSGLEVTVREQQRWVHEKGEGELENKDTWAITFLTCLEPCVYELTHEDVRSTQ